MRCDEVRPLIESYLDGEVAEATATLIAHHLVSCAGCAQFQTQFEDEQNFYLANESDIDVPATFWSDVFETVAQQKAVQTQGVTEGQELSRFRLSAIRFGPLAAAAIVLLTVGITTGIMKYLSTSQTEPEPGLVARGNGPVASPTPSASGRDAERETGRKNEPAVARGQVPRQDVTDGNVVAAPKVRRTPARRQSPDDLVREAEQKYIAAIAMLSRDSNRRRQQLDPDARAQFEQTLAVIDRAIASTRQAVNASPGDPVAVQFMLAAYSKKVDVLRHMVDD